MAYEGIIKKSRSLDAQALSVMVDAASLGFLAYSPEQLGIGIPIYMCLRIVLTAWAAYLRFQTTTPVGEKP